MPELTIHNGPNAGSKFSFDRSVVIGRGPLADLSFEDPLVSRRHARLSWDDGDCFLSDLGSENGTFLNNARLTDPVRLRNGDSLTFGSVIAEYNEQRADGGAAIAEDVEEPSIRVIHKASDSAVISSRMDADTADAEVASANTEGAPTFKSRQFEFFSEFGRVISHSFDQDRLLSFVLNELMQIVPYVERVFIMLWDEDAETLVPKRARARSGEVEEIAVSRTLLEEVMTSRQGVLVLDSQDDARYQDSGSLRALDIRSAICVPMLFQDQFYGVIQADSSSGVRPFRRRDMALMLGAASQVAMFLAHERLRDRLQQRERVERDMMLARKVQQQFLPQGTPDIPGYDFAVDYSPALAVGGDYYDFPFLSDGRIGIAVGDVSGKGVSAALYVAKLTSDLRYQAVRCAEPAEILRRVNLNLAGGDTAGMFVTLALLALEPKSGKLEVASAGHPLPIVRHRQGEVTSLGKTGDPPLGLDPNTTFAQHGYQLDPSDVVMLYTDGINEAEDRAREMFGEERLRAVVGKSAGVSNLLNAVLSAVKGFVGDNPQSDDITVLCFGREG